MAVRYTKYNDDTGNRETHKTEADQQATGGIINGEQCETPELAVWEIEPSERRGRHGVMGEVSEEHGYSS